MTALPLKPFGLLFTFGVLNLVGQNTDLYSRDAHTVVDLFILVIGGWALLELIKLGKKMATKDDVTELRHEREEAAEKLRDDLTARLDDLTKRLDRHLEQP